MRTALNNPFAAFVPGSDAVPEVWAGRAAQIADFHREVRPRRLAGAFERGRVFTGIPRIGKSSLAARICADAREIGDLVLPSLGVVRGQDPVAMLAAAIGVGTVALSLEDRMASVDPSLLERIVAIGDERTVTASGEPAGVPHREVMQALSALAKIAMEDGRMLVLHVDDLQHIHDLQVMSRLLVAIGEVLVETAMVPDAAGNLHKRHLPIAVMLTGLVSFTDDAARAGGGAFGRRFTPHHLGPVEDADIRTALAPFTTTGWAAPDTRDGKVVTMTDAALWGMIDAILGDPHLLQMVGGAAWDAGDSPVIDEDQVNKGIQAVADQMRDHAMHGLQRLPQAERVLLEALLRMPEDERTLTAAGRALGKQASQLGTASQRLELRSMIRRGSPIVVVSRTTEALMGGRWPLDDSPDDDAPTSAAPADDEE